MQKNNEKQTALKLLNKYAEEYHILEDKLSLLQKENEDLKSNLQINKDIIQGFFQNSSIEDKVQIYISKIKEETAFVSTRLVEKEKENKATKDKFTSYEQRYFFIKEELNKAKTKCFLLENIIIEKDSIIQNLTKKARKTHSDDNESKVIEVYITNPNELVTKLNDRIELYKDINTRLSFHIKQLRATIIKNEKVLVSIELENAKYKQELNAFKLQNNNNTILMQMNQSPTFNRVNTPKSINTIDTKSILNTSKLNKSANITSDHTRSDCYHGKSRRSMLKEIKKLEGVNKNKQSINQFDLTKEWYETLKNCGMSQEEYVRFCNNKSMNKLTEVIEYLYKLIIDKNVHIKLLMEENDNLIGDNLNLNRLNIELNDEIEMLKCSLAHKSKAKTDDDNSTFVHYAEECDNTKFRNEGYMCQIRESISSSEFRSAMVFDNFDLESEMSKKQGDDSLANVYNKDQIKICDDI